MAILLFSLGFMTGKLTTKPVVRNIIPPTIENCAIHSFPAETPLLINTNTGYVGELRIYPRSAPNYEQSKPYGVMMTGNGEGYHYFAFPDEDYLDLSIYQESIEPFDISLASTYFCSECLNTLHDINSACNYVIVLKKDEKFIMHSIDEIKNDFSDVGFSFATHGGSEGTVGVRVSYSG